MWLGNCVSSQGCNVACNLAWWPHVNVDQDITTDVVEVLRLITVAMGGSGMESFAIQSSPCTSQEVHVSIHCLIISQQLRVSLPDADIVAKLMFESSLSCNYLVNHTISDNTDCQLRIIKV